VIVWLWDAAEPGHCHGITDDDTRAIAAAETCIRNGSARTARVEQARLMIGGFWLTSHYHRTGEGWSARQGSGGGITWMPLAPAPEIAASELPQRAVGRETLAVRRTQYDGIRSSAGE